MSAIPDYDDFACDRETIASSIVSEWERFQGAVPAHYDTCDAQVGYVLTEIVRTWGAPDLTVEQLRASTNPLALLPRRLFGTAQLVGDVMGYLRIV